MSRLMAEVETPELRAPALSRPIRVAHVVLSLDVGGLERNVVNQAREADRLGQAFEVVCLERRGALSGQVEEAGGRVVGMGKGRGTSLALVGRLRAEFRRSRPDVVHTHQAGGLFYAATAAWLAGVPVVVHTEHGKHYATRRAARLLGRAGGLHVDRFYCLSRDMADEVARARVVPARKLRRIANGIDLGRFRDAGDPRALRASMGIGPDAIVIGTAGRLAEIKRQDILIRAFAQLRASDPRLRLVLAGEGGLRPELEALARSLEVEASVVFAGYTDRPQHYHHAFDIFALTSRSEGTPQALIEAGVAGRPPVASRVGGIPEMILHGETGLLFDLDRPDDLADALRRLIDDPTLRASMGEAHRAEMEGRYDIRRMADEYHRDYLDLLGPGRVGPAAPPSGAD